MSLTGEPVGFIDELLSKRGRRRRVVLTVPSFMMALMHLARSDLLAVLPRRLVLHHAKILGLIAAELPFKRHSDTVQAVVTKAAQMDAGVAWLLAKMSGLHAGKGRLKNK